MISIRTSRTEDFAEIGARLPPRSSIGYTVFEDDQVIGLGGIYPHHSRYVVYCDIRPDILAVLPHTLKYKRALVKAAKLVLIQTARSQMPVHAAPDIGIESAESFLTHLGFDELIEGVWQWQRPHGLFH